MTHTQSEDTMTSGWKTVKLGEIAQIQTGPFGSQLHKKDYVDCGTPIVTVEHLGNKHFTEQNLPRVSDADRARLNKYTLKEGDVVFSRVGSVDRCSYVDQAHDGWMFSGRCLRVRPTHSIDSEYMYYYFCLENTKQFVRNIAVGSTMPSINTQLMGEISVSLPPLDVQRRIAAVLKPLDDKIELNARINARLERVAQALFKRHFVRFEPYGGTLPPGWRVGTLGEIAHITMGQSPDGKSYNDKGIGTVFFQGRSDFGFRFPTVRLFTTEPKRMAKKRDVLLSVRAPVGDVNEAHEDCCIGRGLAAIQSKNGCQSFLLYTMFSLKKQLEVFNAEGTVFGCINRDSLNAMPILIPTDDAIKEFERIVAPMDEMIRSNTDESRTLARLRDVLLPRLMSGAVDVGQVRLNTMQEGGSR